MAIENFPTHHGPHSLIGKFGQLFELIPIPHKIFQIRNVNNPQNFLTHHYYSDTKPKRPQQSQMPIFSINADSQVFNKLLANLTSQRTKIIVPYDQCGISLHI